MLMEVSVCVIYVWVFNAKNHCLLYLMYELVKIFFLFEDKGKHHLWNSIIKTHTVKRAQGCLQIVHSPTALWKFPVLQLFQVFIQICFFHCTYNTSHLVTKSIQIAASNAIFQLFIFGGRFQAVLSVLEFSSSQSWLLFLHWKWGTDVRFPCTCMTNRSWHSAARNRSWPLATPQQQADRGIGNWNC